MTFYDPKVDPRWIPPQGDPEVFEPQVDETEERLVALERSRQIWDNVEALFAHPGWYEYVQIIAKDRDQLENRIRRETDQVEWKFMRGQLLHADWILQIPDEVRKAHAKVNDELRTLTEEQEGADHV